MSGGGAEFEYPDEAGYPDGTGTLHEGVDGDAVEVTGGGASGGGAFPDSWGEPDEIDREAETGREGENDREAEVDREAGEIDAFAESDEEDDEGV
ncbi:hypothetical protein ACDF64_11740 [Agromyces sp. MMS24-JH15]|uniref:hypothetical protein n=1 Tax=Agromyces sp. MMS24-JH15 TaxID=3243765 RepID=UPI003747E7EF